MGVLSVRENDCASAGNRTIVILFVNKHEADSTAGRFCHRQWCRALRDRDVEFTTEQSRGFSGIIMTAPPSDRGAAFWLSVRCSCLRHLVQMRSPCWWEVLRSLRQRLLNDGGERVKMGALLRTAQVTRTRKRTPKTNHLQMRTYGLHDERTSRAGPRR